MKNNKHIIVFIGLLFILFIIIISIPTKNKNNYHIDETQTITEETSKENNYKVIETEPIETDPYYDSLAGDIICSDNLIEMFNSLIEPYELNNMRNLSALDLEMLTGITTDLYEEFYGKINEENNDIVFIFKEKNSDNNKLNTKLWEYKDYLYQQNINNKEILNKIENINLIKMNDYCFYYALGNLKNGSMDSYSVLQQKGLKSLINYFNENSGKDINNYPVLNFQ